jgi:hypothetical protein
MLRVAPADTLRPVRPRARQPPSSPPTAPTQALRGPTLRPLRGRSGHFVATSASRFRIPPFSGCICDARFSSAIARSPLSALPALFGFCAALSSSLSQLCRQTVDVESFTQHTLPLQAGRPSAGQPSAERKPFGSGLGMNANLFPNSLNLVRQKSEFVEPDSNLEPKKFLQHS